MVRLMFEMIGRFVYRSQSWLLGHREFFVIINIFKCTREERRWRRFCMQMLIFECGFYMQIVFLCEWKKDGYE
jgi:hypothetical protein